jgi:hypothetical protein
VTGLSSAIMPLRFVTVNLVRKILTARCARDAEHTKKNKIESAKCEGLMAEDEMQITIYALCSNSSDRNQLNRSTPTGPISALSASRARYSERAVILLPPSTKHVANTPKSPRTIFPEIPRQAPLIMLYLHRCAIICVNNRN